MYMYLLNYVLVYILLHCLCCTLIYTELLYIMWFEFVNFLSIDCSMYLGLYCNFSGVHWINWYLAVLGIYVHGHVLFVLKIGLLSFVWLHHTCILGHYCVFCVLCALATSCCIQMYISLCHLPAHQMVDLELEHFFA